MLALSPWAVRNIRFDESLGQFHGYDLDFCLQVREAGRKVVTADFRAVHHRALELVRDPEKWIEAHMRVAEKWDERIGAGDWHERARRAEAEATLARRSGGRQARGQRRGDRAPARARRVDRQHDRGGSPRRCGA